MRKLTLGKIVKNGVTYSGSSDNADNVKYNNNASNLDATNVQEAIDKLDESVDTLNSNLNSSLGSLFKIVSGQSTSFNIEANSWIEANINISIPSGYITIGIMNWSTNTGSVSPTQLLVSNDGKVHTVLRNNNSLLETVILSITLICIREECVAK